MIYERAKTEYEQLCNRITGIRNELQELPPGKLICCHQKNSSKWYLSDGHRKFYISKANRVLAQQLAKKKYLSFLLEDLENEKIALSFYLRHHAPSGKSEKLLASSEYQSLLAPYFSPLSQELADWMNSPYERNSAHPESLIYKGISNTLLRSKSEMLIDMFLRTHRIPFRYECALKLNNTVLYPDFTIRHPRTGNFYYWEHFGLMDNPAYVENVMTKLRLYVSCGIIPSIHLITTFETKVKPLNPEIIEKYIEYYFL